MIGASVTLYAIEFVADKIPAIDLIWNALQTFVRIPVAALLAYAATAWLSPVEQLLAATLGGCIALIAHGGKTAVRVAVTPSPEPLSKDGRWAVVILPQNPNGVGTTSLAFMSLRGGQSFEVCNDDCSVGPNAPVPGSRLTVTPIPSSTARGLRRSASR